MENIKLTIFGAYTIVNENSDVLSDCPHAKDQGIYLWCVKTNSGVYKPTYIGETGNSFYQRTKEHLIQTFGGNYQVCDARLLKMNEMKIIWNGLWRKGTRDKFPEFIKQYEVLAPKIKEYIAVQKLFVIPFKEDDTKLRRRIESTLARTFIGNKAAACLMPHDIRYLKPVAEKDQVTISFEYSSLIFGFPESFIA